MQGPLPPEVLYFERIAVSVRIRRTSFQVFTHNSDNQKLNKPHLPVGYLTHGTDRH